MKWVRKTKILILVCIFLLALSAAYLAYWPGYVLHAAWEETKILLQRKKITEVIKNKNTPTEIRNKLALAVETKDFAKNNLGLATDKLYEHYSEVSDTLAFVVSASPKNKLINKTWWFPIVGSVPYLGFFDEEEARRAAKKLKEKEFDTYLRPTAAFSTLGWLPDPILSTVLKGDSLYVVETIIHESTHKTIWVKGNARFNESLAKFVGMVGAKEFFCERADESWGKKAEANLHDALLISDFFDTIHDSLSVAYERIRDPGLVSKVKIGLLRNFHNNFQRDIKPLLRSNRYLQMDITKLNNASFLARHLYYHKLRSFHNTYSKSGRIQIFLKQLISILPQYTNPWDAVNNI